MTQLSPTSSTSVDRPNPLKEAASKVGTAWSAVSGVIGALVTFGLLTSAQGEAITLAGAEAQNTVTAVGTVLGGVLPLIAGVITSFRTTAAARDHVTPVASPRDNLGNVLVPAGPATGVVTQSPAAGPTVADRDPGTVSDGDTWTS